MAIPPDLMSSFAQPQDMDPMAAMRERAVLNAESSMPEEGRTDYQDGHDDDGWSYRYFDDGKVKILSAPEGHKAGQILDGGRAYDAIMARKPVLLAPKTPLPEAAPPPANPALPTTAADPMRQAIDSWRAGAAQRMP